TEWVRKGGVLVYCGRDNDPFQRVQEWWNTEGKAFNAPSEHLFQKLGLSAPFEGGEYSYGEGKVFILRQDPKEFIMNEDNDAEFVSIVKRLYENNTDGGVLQFKNSFALTRGPYEIISVLDEHS